jgi:hypothetical protein
MIIENSSFDGQMYDITAPPVVEVEIRQDSKVLWVNVNGICALRICQIGELAITDNRK